MPVFYNNFRQLQQLHGLEIKNSEKSLSSATSCLEDSANSISTSSIIVSRKRLRDDEDSDLNEGIEDLDSRLTRQNRSVLMAVYKDHSLTEIVSICVTLPSGVNDIRFTLDVTGPATTLATITYTWPQVMFDIEGLFASAIKKTTMTVDRPKIPALKLELENNRQHIDRKHQGSMEISLPIPVKTDPKTVKYKLDKGTDDGVIELIADLCAFNRSYTAIKPEFKCDFEDF